MIIPQAFGFKVLAGTGTRINAILDSMGFKNTRVNSRTAGRENNRTNYGWGQTTPREMGTLFEMIYRNKLFSAAACERMMRCLGRNFWDENEAISQIPPYIEVFSKNGCVDAVRSEVLLVNAPHNPYIFCIFTKNNKDTSWTHDNEAWSLARKISKQLWDYFEPKDKWEAGNKLECAIFNLFQQLIRNQTNDIRHSCHINQLYQWPFPAACFSFYNGQCTHALHGKYIKQHQRNTGSQVNKQACHPGEQQLSFFPLMGLCFFRRQHYTV